MTPAGKEKPLPMFDFLAIFVCAWVSICWVKDNAFDAAAEYQIEGKLPLRLLAGGLARFFLLSGIYIFFKLIGYGLTHG